MPSAPRSSPVAEGEACRLGHRGRLHVPWGHHASALAGRRLAAAAAGLRKASELFKHARAIYSRNEPCCRVYASWTGHAGQVSRVPDCGHTVTVCAADQDAGGRAACFTAHQYIPARLCVTCTSLDQVASLGASLAPTTCVYFQGLHLFTSRTK